MASTPLFFASAGYTHLTADETTASSAAAGTPPVGAKAFLLTVKTIDAYVTFDGTAPTSSNGLSLTKALAPVYYPVSASSIRVLAQSTGTTVVDVAWLK